MDNRNSLLNNLGLYMVTADSPNRSHIELAKAAITGGATVVQYRDKTSTSRVMYEYALELRELTIRQNVMFIVNDRIDIALVVKADGVHLGQNDVELGVAREIMGNEYIIGISATSFEEAIEAADKGADYVGVGPIFLTGSKDDAADPIGLDELRRVRKTLSIPIVAIGGISIDNSESVVKAGADGIAVISAIASAPDMIKAARDLSSVISLAKSNRVR